ncbi:hypothetical protein COU56_04900 [Candidatus Pacearchaeota archaeon CG10_big_fil_rev_8_21_14_0_10_31_9]|nr:MAG: hypothetical protein COU56_04900 [Candidatus Pacearchaeota archaeon CG10_big_fil_rev_8_21_14_0_10_31_9]PIZ82475.1 MAG: hypothetical protein COX97_04620 [Candidatus Pacearchaeota archaeon CG_4_10_14_0_2_um_filter_05_32_18]
METNRNYSGVMIENSEGKLLFQLRDNNPTISNPNKWSLFGGGIEKGEAPIETAIREIKEELGLTLNKTKLKLLFKKESPSGNRYVFYYKLYSLPKNLKINEGEHFEFLSLFELIFRRNVVNSLRAFIFIYPLLKIKMILREKFH